MYACHSWLNLNQGNVSWVWEYITPVLANSKVNCCRLTYLRELWICFTSICSFCNVGKAAKRWTMVRASSKSPSASINLGYLNHTTRKLDEIEQKNKKDKSFDNTTLINTSQWFAYLNCKWVCFVQDEKHAAYSS